MLDHPESNDFADEVRAQFISILTHIAEACEIDGLPHFKPEDTDYRSYTTFRHHLSGIVAKVKLKSLALARPYSTSIGRKAHVAIAQEIDILRRLISESDLPSRKKSTLAEKLDELEDELKKQRLSFAKTMSIVAFITTAISGTTVAIANAPKAIESVTRIIALVGQEKEAEEAERIRLAPPPKTLPDLSPKASPVRGGGFADDLDDDVPF